MQDGTGKVLQAIFFDAIADISLNFQLLNDAERLIF
jgi:hypothetical protein